MAGERGSLRRNPFLQATVSSEADDFVIENHVIFCVEPRLGHLRRYSHPDRVSNALSQRSGRCFDSRSFMKFWMSGRFAVQLAEILQLFQGEIISGHMKPGVKEHAA